MAARTEREKQVRQKASPILGESLDRLNLVIDHIEDVMELHGAPRVAAYIDTELGRRRVAMLRLGSHGNGAYQLCVNVENKIGERIWSPVRDAPINERLSILRNTGIIQLLSQMAQRAKPLPDEAAVQAEVNDILRLWGIE